MVLSRIPGKMRIPLPFPAVSHSYVPPLEGGSGSVVAQTPHFKDVNTRDMRLNLQAEGQGIIFDNPVEAEPKGSCSLA